MYIYKKNKKWSYDPLSFRFRLLIETKLQMIVIVLLLMHTLLYQVLLGGQRSLRIFSPSLFVTTLDVTPFVFGQCVPCCHAINKPLNKPKKIPAVANPRIHLRLTD